jgi:two-component system, sensor histidine kinase and response regulator
MQMTMVCQDDRQVATGPYDPTVMLERIGGDMCLFAELVALFLEDYPPLLDEMNLAIAANDASRLKLAAHTLRGAIGNFTVDSPYDLAKQLESMGQTNNLRDARATLRSLTDGIDQLAIALTRSLPSSVS